MTVISISCAIGALGISLISLIHGGTKLLKKGKPLYCQIIMWAVMCYFLQCLETCVLYLCGDFSDQGSIGQIAMCGFFIALLSANYGALDSIVDDKSEKNTKSRKYALLAPIVLLIAIFFALKIIYPIDAFSGTMYGLAMLPMVPASYFSLKHLLLPKDDMGFLACTKKINIICIMIYIVSLSIILIYGITSPIVRDILNIGVSVLVLLLTLATEEGEKRWPI